MKSKKPELSLAQHDELIKTVAVKIRPLPDNVLPSERFMKQMRSRLLDLQPRAPRQAA
jgi:hypothetical protein